MKKFLATVLSFAMLLGAGLMQVSALGSNEGYPPICLKPLRQRKV